MRAPYLLDPTRQLTATEEALLWHKPATHITSAYETRICHEVQRNWHHPELKITNILLEGDAGSGKTQLAKALAADFGLPYTKITCFADMDKSDVLGALLPVVDEADATSTGPVRYTYYPSEIVQAFENGWLLEIQEPTMIRDAAVLMALNAALEAEGTINLPTRIVKRHPDFIAVITTNRGYNGCRPLNEALRDRMQHSEKMDLPPQEVMMARGKAKTGCTDEAVLSVLAESIMVLDQTAKANGIKGAAGMRSYFFWLDAVFNGASAATSIYQKVLYKMTTDPTELAILIAALTKQGLMTQLAELTEQAPSQPQTQTPVATDTEVLDVHVATDGTFAATETEATHPNALRLRRAADSTGHTETTSASTSAQTQSSENGTDGSPIYHELTSPITLADAEKTLRKTLNQEARASVKGSIHEKTKLVVHRISATPKEKAAYNKEARVLRPVIQELIQRTQPLLVHETTNELRGGQLYGNTFQAARVATPDLHYFARKTPPTENPTLAVTLRIDESASMSAFGRITAAQKAALALYEFCHACGIPIMIYGDTADRTRLEQMSIYAYVDFASQNPDEKYALMHIQPRSNNRDGMALRILSQRLLQMPQTTKLLISLSDGQPKALPDYAGARAIADMQTILAEFRRQGITYLACAIGQDQEVISQIYGSENTIDLTDLQTLPQRLVQIIANYL